MAEDILPSKFDELIEASKRGVQEQVGTIKRGNVDRMKAQQKASDLARKEQLAAAAVNKHGQEQQGQEIHLSKNNQLWNYRAHRSLRSNLPEGGNLADGVISFMDSAKQANTYLTQSIQHGMQGIRETGMKHIETTKQGLAKSATDWGDARNIWGGMKTDMSLMGGVMQLLTNIPGMQTIMNLLKWGFGHIGKFLISKFFPHWITGQKRKDYKEAEEKMGIKKAKWFSDQKGPSVEGIRDEKTGQMIQAGFQVGDKGWEEKFKLKAYDAGVDDKNAAKKLEELSSAATTPGSIFTKDEGLLDWLKKVLFRRIVFFLVRGWINKRKDRRIQKNMETYLRRMSRGGGRIGGGRRGGAVGGAKGGAGATRGISGAFTGIVSTLGRLASALWVAIAAIGTAIAGLLAPALPFIAIGVLLIALGVLIWFYWDEIKEAWNKGIEYLKGLGPRIKQFFQDAAEGLGLRVKRFIAVMYDGVAWLVNSVITAFQNKLRKAGFSGDRLEKFKMTGGAVDAVDTEIAAFQAKKAARGEEVAAASIDVDQAREILNQKGAGGGQNVNVSTNTTEGAKNTTNIVGSTGPGDQKTNQYNEPKKL